MTRKTHQWQRWTKLPLAVAVAAGVSGHAAAYSFYVGDVEAQFNTVSMCCHLSSKLLSEEIVLLSLMCNAREPIT